MVKQSKKARRTKATRKKKTDATFCSKCIPAKCCMYFSTEIDEPESFGDFDDILWMLAHRDVEIYTHGRRWYVLVRNACRFYNPMIRCTIYNSRPRICREHRHDDCEFSDDYDFDLHFRSYEELDRFIRKTFAIKRAERIRGARRVLRSFP